MSNGMDTGILTRLLTDINPAQRAGATLLGQTLNQGPSGQGGIPPGAFWLSDTTYGVPMPGNQGGHFDVAGNFLGSYDATASGAGGGGPTPEELGLARDELAETVRHNLQGESIMRRQTALDVAKSAVDVYMDALDQSRRGREAAVSEARQLLPSLVPPGQKYWSGLEPTGALSTMMQRYGLPFSPTEVVHKQLTPAMLATEPQVSPAVAYMLRGLTGVQEVQ